MTGFVRLTWRDRNWLEDRHIIYRSTSPIDVEDLPEPIAELDSNVTEYIDTDVEEGKTYFYRVGARFRFSEAVSEQFSVTATPSLDITAYSVSTDNTLQTIGPDGFMEASNDTNTAVIYGVVSDINGNVYTASTSANRIRKFDSDGNEVWQSDVPSANYYMMDVDEDMNLFVTASDNTVRKLDPNGDVVWEFTEHTNNTRDVFFDWIDNQLLSIGQDGRLFSIDPDTGNGELYVDGLATGYSVTKDLDGNIIAGSSSGIRKFRWDGNGLDWHNSSIGIIGCAAVDTRGHVYAASHSNFVVKLHRDTGEEIWRGDQFSNNVNTVRVDDDGYVYAGSSDTQVIKYDGETGDVIWRYHGHISNVWDVAVTRFPYYLNRPGNLRSSTDTGKRLDNYVFAPENLRTITNYDTSEDFGGIL